MASIYKAQNFTKVRKEIAMIDEAAGNLKYSQADDERLMEQFPWILEDMGSPDESD